MATTGRRWSKAQVTCPRPEHAGSRVRFDGRYGKSGQRRQLYRCTPQNGQRPHTASLSPLPREEAWHGSCEVCERAVGLHEGPHAARHYQFVARGIAEALRAVGAGATYRQAALVARERARRLRANPNTGELRLTRHGQLVMDWVEVFAPVVFAAHRPARWPATGSLLLDDLPFSVRDPAHRELSDRLSGLLRGRLRARSPEALARRGLPRRGPGQLGGVPAARGRATTNRLRRPLRPQRSGAGRLPRRRALPLRVAPAPRARAAHGQHPPLRARAPHGDRFAVGPPRGCLHRPAPARRRYGLKNRQRTNRLLLLMLLHVNRKDDEQTYAKDIRAWLEVNHGHPGVDRRAVKDTRERPALR